MASKREKTTQKARQDIIENALVFAQKVGYLPSLHSLAQDSGISRSTLRNYFNSDDDLSRAVVNYCDEHGLKVSFHTSADFCSAKMSEHILEIKKHNRFFITSAEPGRPLWKKGAPLMSIKHWCMKRKALPIIIPIGRDLLRLDGAFKGLPVLTDDIYLNSNLKIASFLTSVTAISPSSGLTRISGQDATTTIFGSAKLLKESIATDSGKMAHLLMSPGAITEGDYKSEGRIIRSKSQYIASHDHEISGLIVEIKDENTFFVKEVMFDTDGSFIEVNKKHGALRYHSDGRVTKEQALNMNLPDGHVEEMDHKVNTVMLDIAKRVKPETVCAHDVFSYMGPGHHNAEDKIHQAKLFEKGWSLKDDVQKLNKYLSDWSKVTETLYVVNSNHDNHLEKAVKSFQLDQPATYRIFLEMSLALMDNLNPLEFVLQKYTDFKKVTKNAVFLKKRERLVLKNKFGELSLHFHGHVGADGSRGTGTTGKSSLAVAIGCAIVGHSHSPRIIPGGSFGGFGNGGVWVNGVSTPILGEGMPEYTDGPSSWLNTLTLTFGQKSGRFLRTQLTIINGEYSLD